MKADVEEGVAGWGRGRARGVCPPRLLIVACVAFLSGCTASRKIVTPSVLTSNDVGAMVDGDDEMAVGMVLRAPVEPCYDVLNANGGTCPPEGCAGKGAANPDDSSTVAKAAQNRAKRNLPEMSGRPRLLTFLDFARLQGAVDDHFPPGEGLELSPSDRKALGLLIGSVRVKEGDYVARSGYLSGDGKRRPGPAGLESVNCKESDAVDFHIPVTESQGEDEHHSIVVEMIPQHRLDSWTAPKLKSLFKSGTLVRIKGQLFFDNEHLKNGDPAHDKKGQPKRFGLWEIHPVTSFDVCTAEACDLVTDSSWTPLSSWTEQ